MLSIWRPYFMCVIPRCGGQPPQIGPVGPDRVNVIVVFIKASEGDEISSWRPGWKVVKSGSQHCHGSVVQIHDPKTVFRVAPEAIHDSLTIRRPTRKTIVSRSLD